VARADDVGELIEIHNVVKTASLLWGNFMFFILRAVWNSIGVGGVNEEKKIRIRIGIVCVRVCVWLCSNNCILSA
jgi:hypothetical protein